MSTTRRKTAYRVKKEYVGRVRLESATTRIVLDATTPQAVLAQLYETVLGKGFIELVPEKAPKPQ
ncbi:hypothetical protein [Rudanella lutea]|uniref:hypothetical protein n=1 Tax=Rudanella lutea TaxID=451374 RepID=UPI0003A27BC9|nr:hypothetical protein [Rudanella lutea]